jgi:hypothetical protein
MPARIEVHRAHRSLAPQVHREEVPAALVPAVPVQVIQTQATRLGDKTL